jgi:serine O-acetyltransferase
MFSKLREDIAAIRQKDPAARSAWEVLTCYPGMHALLFHSVAHACWRAELRWLGRFISHLGRFFTGIEIHPGAKMGRRVFIDHGMGVVIGETAEVGDDCTIYQGVTLGGTSLTRGAKRHPTLESGVIVGANAQVLGGFTVGEGAKIGSNAVVVKAVPAGATAVGNPSRVIRPGGVEAALNSGEHARPDRTAAGNGAVDVHAPRALAAQAVRVLNSADAMDGAVRDDGRIHVHGETESRDNIASGAFAPPTDAPALQRPFVAYGITTNADDPMSLAIHGLIAHVAQQSGRIEEIVMALERLGTHVDKLQGCEVSMSDLRQLGEVIQDK